MVHVSFSLANYGSELGGHLNNIRKQMEWTDCCIETKSGIIPVHHIIMSAAKQIHSESKFSFLNDGDKIVSMDKYEKRIVEILVTYLYTGKVVINSKTDVEKFKELCMDLNFENLIQGLQSNQNANHTEQRIDPPRLSANSMNSKNNLANAKDDDDVIIVEEKNSISEIKLEGFYSASQENLTCGNNDQNVLNQEHSSITSNLSNNFQVFPVSLISHADNVSNNSCFTGEQIITTSSLSNHEFQSNSIEDYSDDNDEEYSSFSETCDTADSQSQSSNNGELPRKDHYQIPDSTRRNSQDNLEELRANSASDFTIEEIKDCKDLMPMYIRQHVSSLIINLQQEVNNTQTILSESEGNPDDRNNATPTASTRKTRSAKKKHNKEENGKQTREEKNKKETPSNSVSARENLPSKRFNKQFAPRFMKTKRHRIIGKVIRAKPANVPTNTVSSSTGGSYEEDIDKDETEFGFTNLREECEGYQKPRDDNKSMRRVNHSNTTKVSEEKDLNIRKTGEPSNMKNTEAEKRYKCTKCEKTFISISDRDLHKKRHDWVFSCDKCGKRFPTEEKLGEHKSTHTHKTDLKHKCDACGMCFQRADLLTIHVLELHQDHGRSKFQCNTCDENCHSKTDLKKHMLRHTAKRRYTCTKCNTSFAKARSKLRHTMICTGKEKEDGKFKCKFCNKTLSSSKSLITHLTNWHTDPTFQCPKCGKMFKWENNLSKHMAENKCENVQ